MDLFSIEFYAHSLGGAARVHVLLPSPEPQALQDRGAQAVYAGLRAQRWPALLLLHGMQGSESAWLRHSMVEQHAAQAGVAVIMPSLLNSYGCDLGFGLSFEEYLRCELPAFLESRLPLDLSPQQYTVAGLSMGGFTALRLAALEPRRYAAAGSFSGALDPAAVVRRMGRHAAGAALAPADALAPLAGGGAQIPLYLACGAQDEIALEMNRQFHARLCRQAVAHTYEEWDGGHEWAFWDRALHRFLAWRAGIVKESAPCAPQKEGA